MPLHTPFVASAARFPDRAAVAEPERGEVTYAELDALTRRVRDYLAGIGVEAGDRVGVYLPKSIDSVACLLGILRAGAAYVPVDPGSPVDRARYILNDCSVRALFVERGLAEGLARAGGLPDGAAVLALDGVGRGRPLAGALEGAGGVVADGLDADPAADALAYILYTSGSTGWPKGVMISHRAATAFVDWCSDVFQPTADDRFSSHAPFHFDLSIHDLYVPLKHGARLTLIGEELGKDPGRLAATIASERLTIWYSTPSILSLLSQYGKLERHDVSALRIVLFAGEVFPVPALRAVKALVPHPRYFNLYGPTETNVCTYYEIPAEIEADRTVPYPIGWACAHYRAKVIDLDDNEVPPGTPGELLMAGPGVMSGYWNLPERNAAAFSVDAAGIPWYRTGDLVVDTGGVFLFRGRRDRMVKRRGYRIELGEIEAALSGHPAVREVAAVSVPDDASGVRIAAFISSRGGERLSIIALKQFCAERLPSYMSPDTFHMVEALPRTSTDKIDLQQLKAMA